MRIIFSFIVAPDHPDNHHPQPHSTTENTKDTGEKQNLYMMRPLSKPLPVAGIDHVSCQEHSCTAKEN